MIYVEKINKVLLPKSHFCGGLSLGFEAVGFKTLGVDLDSFAAKTYTQNLIGNCIEKKLDTNIDFIDYVDIVIGGHLASRLVFEAKVFA